MIVMQQRRLKPTSRYASENVRICAWDDVVAFLDSLPFKQFHKQWLPVLMELWTADAEDFAANHVKLSLALSYVRDRYCVEKKLSSHAQTSESRLRMKIIQKVMNTRPKERLVGAPLALDEAIREIVHKPMEAE